MQLSNLSQISQVNSKPSKNYQKKQLVSFGGASNYFQKVAEKKAFINSLPFVSRLLAKFKMGEASNIGINAVGTGLIAPVFIAYNPISKTDEKTKKYSALRQPISAVLAVITQVGLLIPFNKFMNGLSNRGQIGAFYDLSVRQDDKFISRQLKKENPALSKEQLKEAVKKRAERQFNKAVKYAEENHSIKNKAGKIILKPEDFLKKMKKTAEKLLENKKLKSEHGIFSSIIEAIDKKKSVYNIKKLATNLADTNIVRKTVSTHISDAQKAVSANKGIWGSLFTLAILPFTCTALNWVYPRIMDKFFPELAKPKKAGD